MSQYLGIYDQMYQKYVLKPYEKRPEYVISALWVNYQKQHEFNPPHDHDGKLSFVAYLQIPEELKKNTKLLQVSLVVLVEYNLYMVMGQGIA